MRASWSRADAHEIERQIFGQPITDEWVAEHGPVDAFPDESGRSMFKLRAALFEIRQETSGLVNQEIARSLLESGLLDRPPYQVACMADYSDDIDITSKPAFQAVARAYLQRLARHEFTFWPPHIREALGRSFKSRRARRTRRLGTTLPLLHNPSRRLAALCTPPSISGKPAKASPARTRPRTSLPPPSSASSYCAAPSMLPQSRPRW